MTISDESKIDKLHHHLNDNDNNSDDDETIHVVIVGSGMAGLSAAKELLVRSTTIHNNNNNSSNANNNKKNKIHVTIVESNNYAGGRVHGDTTLIPGYVIDTGAEVMHGGGTLLTSYVDFLSSSSNHDGDFYDHKNHQPPLYNPKWKTIPKQELIQEFFLLSHADGGPDISKTQEGMYGMYYLNNELVMFDDEQVRPIEQILGQLEHYDDEYVYLPNADDKTKDEGEDENYGTKKKIKKKYESVGQIMSQHLPSSLHSLAVASYGNTAGSNDLNQINLSLICNFEQYWEENETEGDKKLSPKVGMAGVAKELWYECSLFDNFDLKLNWKVDSIVQKKKNDLGDNDDQDDNDDTTLSSYTVSSANGEQITNVNYVIVTTPPPLWNRFLPNFSSSKQNAVNHLGINPAMKCILKFKSRFWPEKLQSLAMADCIIPEMWLYDVGGYSIAVCFLTSQAVLKLEEEVATIIKAKINANHTDTSSSNDNHDSEKGVSIVFYEQMSKVLSIPMEEIQNVHLETRIYRWDLGYMFPKVGFTKNDLHELAKPMGNIGFAGEATNTNACCTVQAAMETGIREARRILECISDDGK